MEYGKKIYSSVYWVGAITRFIKHKKCFFWVKYNSIEQNIRTVGDKRLSIALDIESFFTKPIV